MEVKVDPTFQHVTWILKDFLELPQKGNSYLDSPEFVFSGDTYCLRLHPNVNEIATVRIHVRRLRVTFPQREVSCKLGIREKDSTGGDCYYYLTLKALVENLSYDRSSLEENRDRYVQDGSLTIGCFMWLIEDSRAGSSAKEEGDQRGFPGQEAPISSRCPPKRELSTEFPCTFVHLTIPKVFDLPRETRDSLTSPEFRFAGDTYCFRFCPNDDTHDTDLQLVRLTSNIPERTVSYRVGHSWGRCHIYPKNSRLLAGSTGSCITRSDLEKERCYYVSNGTLRLLLFLRMGEQSNAGAGTSDAVQKRTGLSGIRKLQSDLRQLLQKGTESDACVVVCGKEFTVHRVVLRSRSTVFEAMFSHDTAEKESGRVVVDDLDPDSFGDFLEYLYTGDVRDKLSDDNAFGLYVAADKYDVSTLKSDCVEHMRRTLSVDSFCDVVTLALRHGEEDLLQRAIRFFKDNLQRIIITAKW